VKTFLFAIMLAGMTAGFATQASAYDACAGNNSRACTNARNAYAEHHGGVFPGQNAYYNGGNYYANRGEYVNRGYAGPRHHHHHWDHDHR
jgi:hypothetical protein